MKRDKCSTQEQPGISAMKYEAKAKSQGQVLQAKLSETLMAGCVNEDITLWPVTAIMCGKHFSFRETKQSA